jgi:hypothetical protein
VAHSTLLEELSAFRKPALLSALQSGAPATTIHDIRFRVGTVVLEIKPSGAMASGSAVAPDENELSRSLSPPRRGGQGKKSKPGQGSVGS